MVLPEKLRQQQLKDANEYLRKHQLFPYPDIKAARPNLHLAVVIPVHNESEVEPLLSLAECQAPFFAVEVVVVFNAAQSASAKIRVANETLAKRLRAVEPDLPDWLQLVVLEYNHLQDRHAGVGLARKLGMDFAVSRFVSVQNPNGIIVSLDADCQMTSNYLACIGDHYLKNPKDVAATIYFEHRTTGLTEEQTSAILRYELFLRYYVQGLAYANYPAAFHTVGSCFTVLVHAYARRGGMSRRKAGEDFYFLHKLRVLGEIGKITGCTVFPSGRVSLRTPYGTGQAVNKLTTCNPLVYSPRVFDDLRRVNAGVVSLYQTDPKNLEWPKVLWSFFHEPDAFEQLNLFRRSTASQASFKKRFYQWFDGLRVLRLVRHLNRYHGAASLESASLELLVKIDAPQDARTVSGLLDVYRDLEGGRVGG